MTLMHVLAVTTSILQGLLQAPAGHAARTFPDTIVTIAGAPGFFERLGTVASAMMAFAVLILAVGLVVAAWHFRETYNRLSALVERITEESGPMLHKAGAVADDVKDITESVKRNVYAVEETIATANAELLAAVRQTGGQIEQFNALLQVVQDEAKSAFVSAASTVRGVRVGLQTVFDPPPEEEDSDDEIDRGPVVRRDGYDRHGDRRHAPVEQRSDHAEQRLGEQRSGEYPGDRLTGGPRVRPRWEDEADDDLED